MKDGRIFHASRVFVAASKPHTSKTAAMRQGMAKANHKGVAAVHPGLMSLLAGLGNCVSPSGDCPSLVLGSLAGDLCMK
jgi:hypothetical protein